MTLDQKYQAFSDQGLLDEEIPDYVKSNLNPRLVLREYQEDSLRRFFFYITKDKQRVKPTQLLFHMATGSGKTLIMAACMLYLYKRGYRNFMFFVNSTNIIEKTRDNFLNNRSLKYLFSDMITIDGKQVQVREVENFDEADDLNINVVFTTIQGLHSAMSTPRENSLTLEDFKDRQIVIISDEAHHINAWTKNGLTKSEEEEKVTWEQTVTGIFNAHLGNIMLEFTATVDLSNPAVEKKYENKILYEYTLKQFRLDGYSKEVKVLQADLEPIDRAIQAVILSQYRRKVAESQRLHIKPVILFKSKTINESEEFAVFFVKKIKQFKAADIERAQKFVSADSVLTKAFAYFKEQKITSDNLATEIREEFSEAKCLTVNSKTESEEKQLLVNSLEDENNQIRVIFAVDKLNEGWDVLNLFDIVRLYDTRDSHGTAPGKTTIAEAQLIGRGARYCPFVIEQQQDRFKRKYDEDIDSNLRVLEDLYYHSAHNPKYIQELNIALRETGIIPENEPKEIHVKVKDDIKKTEFWKQGFIFVNEQKKADRSKIRTIKDIHIEKVYRHVFRTGKTQDITIFDDSTSQGLELDTQIFKIEEFGTSIIRKAMSKHEFYTFENLKKYFPKLEATSEFSKSVLTEVTVEVKSDKQTLRNLSPDDKLHITMHVLTEMRAEIELGYTEHIGTKIFKQARVKDVVKDKVLNIAVGDGDQEYGVPMSLTPRHDLQLTLADKKWYVYDENYGTSEEKHFVQFINGFIDKLENKYTNIYLLRNEKLFKLYRFSDGKALEPDYVLFLVEKKSKKPLHYQLFIEPKGSHLLAKDAWKQEFLEQIESEYELEILDEDHGYRIVGLPFYNEEMKNEFSVKFKKKLSID